MATGKPDYAVNPKFKGWIYLKSHSIRNLFRQPNRQGLLESFLPILISHLIASYTRQWLLCYNVIAVWLVNFMTFFAVDWSDDPKENEKTDILENRSKTWFGHFLPWALALMYPMVVFYFTTHVESCIHYVALSLMLGLLIKHFPRSFTFAEAFTAAWLITTYTHY
jgi:dolichol kinase